MKSNYYLLIFAFIIKRNKFRTNHLEKDSSNKNFLSILGIIFFDRSIYLTKKTISLR